MNTVLRKLISGILAVVMVFTCLPVAAFAATTSSEDDDSVEIDDGYLSVSVSKQNGGFLVDTLLGNQLKESDDGKHLLFPSDGYDTSFTSFQVTRTSGKVEEYVFGRQYGFLGIYSSDVKTEIKGSSIVSTWSVKDLTIVQTLAFVDETNPQHGQVDISYDVTTSADDVANIKARIMMDTALGSQDYGFYQLHSKDGGYDLIGKEAVIEDAYDNILMAVTADGNSPVTAYTVNAVLDGNEQKPYQVAFGHWANLANTVFAFAPDVTRPAFNTPYDGKYLTADSAYALYYDLGQLGQDQTARVSTYYGVYSNVTVGENERVAINFTQLPNPMVVKDGSTLESASYYSQVAGGNDGDIEVRLSIENLTDKVLEDTTVVVKTMNNVYTYNGNYPMEIGKTEGTYQTTISRINDGDTTLLSLFFNVTPLNLSEYRYFEIEVYNGSTISESNLMGSNGFYLLCPSVLGEEVSFNTTNPQTIYVEGSRSLHISGENFRLLQDTSAYTAYLRPVGGEPENTAAVSTYAVRPNSNSSPQSSSAVIPGTNIVVNQGENTMSVLVENKLEPGVYELVLDWNDDGREDTTSRMLLVHVSDDPSYKMPVYGVVTVERTPEYTKENPAYQLGVYKTEDEYKAAWDKITAESGGKRCIYKDVLLEFRGDFTMVHDPETGSLSMTATSVENPDGTVSGTINISNAISVEGGYVTLRIENPGEEDQCIYTDIDGYVFTSGERTTVWDGVCSLTPIENGEIHELVQYYSDGTEANTIEDTTHIVETIRLLWPAAAGTAQTICGMFFELRYCEFGTIAAEYCDKALPIPNDMDRHRVVAFSAILDPSFLLPTDFLMGERELSNADLAMRTIAKKNYTADQLVEIDKKYRADTDKWLAAQSGTLVMVVDNILFGDNRFIGFDASLDVGIPSYFQGIAGIEGILYLAVWMLDPAEHPFVKIGVEGNIDMKIVSVEAKLVIKTYDGIPVPDELYLYVGGFTPGWNVECHGILWVTGLGGGFSNLYEAIVSKSLVSPFMVSMEGGFSLFQILFARLKLTLGARGFAAQVNGLGFNRDYAKQNGPAVSGIHGETDILTIIPSMGMSVYWYPKFQFSSHVEVNILTVIQGGGYVIIEENTETDTTFFEGLVKARVQTPNIPLIGVLTLANIDLGLDLERIYGALHILKLDMGICYYYGGDVDFSFGKYETPVPTLLSMKVGELADGEPVYLAFGTNITEVASSHNGVVQLSGGNQPGGVVQLGGVTRLDNKVPSIITATDRMHHTITLGDYDDGDTALTVTYTAESYDKARAIAMGGLFRTGLTVTNEAGEEYELTWLDTTEGILDPETADSANALLNYNEETKEASVTISFTDKQDFETAWKLSASAPCDLVMYNLTRLADIDVVSFDANSNTVSWTGSEMADLDKLSIAAIAEDGTLYPLYNTVDSDEIVSGSARVEFPESVPSGNYTIQITAKDEQGNVNDVEESSSKWSYVNPLQPGNPTVSNARLGGDYTIQVDVQANGSVAYTGYSTVIEQKDSTGAWIVSDFAQQDFGADAGTLRVGGSFTSTNFIKKAASDEEEDQTISYSDYMNMSDAEREKVTVETVQTGLEAGVEYRVRVDAYVITENQEILYAEPQYSDAVTMIEPDPADVTVTGLDARVLTEVNSLGETVNRDVYTRNTVTLELTADKPAGIIWSLDSGICSGEGTIEEGGKLTIELPGGEEGGVLKQGEHTLKIRSTNQTGDEATEFYSFRVDSEAPTILISSPQTGSFHDGSVTVTGVSEPGAIIRVVVGDQETTVQVPETVHRKDESGSVEIIEGGHFSVDVELDTTVYEQTISVTAQDAAGNVSRQYDLILVNDIVGKLDAELAIYLNGQDVTGQVIPAGSEGLLELHYVQRDENGLPVVSVAVPANSSQGDMTQWEAYIVAGYGSVTRSDGEVRLETTPDVNGMLVVTVDKQQVSAVLGGNSNRDREYFTITLPENPEGYTVTTDDPVKIGFNGSFSFRVDVKEGYNSDNMKVYANNMELTAVDGVYTISKIATDMKISVTGVVDIAAPEVSVTVDDNKWMEFLNFITFGLFFNKTQEAVITAADNGSGLYGVYCVITDKAIALDDLANAGWTAYTGKLRLDADGNYIVYAKALDNAGNVTYVNSNGLVIDTVAPSVDGIVDGGVYTGEVTFAVWDRNIESVTINGVVVTGELYTLKPADGIQTIVIKDKAGNETVIQVTVNEVPEPEPPECDGKDDCPSGKFPDLDSSAWYHQCTDFVIENGLMEGYPDGTFRPNATLSRAMMVQVLYQLEGKPAVTGTENFTDVADNAWYTDAVIWASGKGVVVGYGNGKFGPNDPVTREQMVTIFYSYSSMKGYSLTEGNYDHFVDRDQVSVYAQSAMRWAVGNGLIAGTDENTLCPKCSSTRAQFAAVIRRFIETIAK